MTIGTSFPDVLFFEEHGHSVISVQAPLSDDQWRMLCARAATRAGHGCGIILDLNGLDVLDAFCASMVRKLFTAVRAHGQLAVVSGIPLSVSVSMIIRNLRIPDVPILGNLPEAVHYLQCHASGRPKTGCDRD
jgi:anti-anti-sigma regulatory factor